MEKNYPSSLSLGDYIEVGIFLLFSVIAVLIYFARPTLYAILLLPIGFVFTIFFILVPKLSQKLTISNATLYFSALGLKSWDVAINQIDMIDEVQHNNYVSKWSFGSRYPKVIGFSISTTNGEQKRVNRSIDDYQSFLKDLLTINPQIKTGKVTLAFNQKFLANPF